MEVSTGNLWVEKAWVQRRGDGLVYSWGQSVITKWKKDLKIKWRKIEGKNPRQPHTKRKKKTQESPPSFLQGLAFFKGWALLLLTQGIGFPWARETFGYFFFLLFINHWWCREGENPWEFNDRKKKWFVKSASVCVPKKQYDWFAKTSSFTKFFHL